MKTIEIPIEKLMLDPNNYRLRGEQSYKYVEDKNVTNVMVQRRVLKMLKGENSANIKDLLDSFKENGYLKIDNIIVREVEKKNVYVVVEGNRRVATLKVLKELYDDGMEIGRLDPEIFCNIESVLYDVNDKDYEILMGLRHVSGIKEWGDYEQSELISNLARKHKMSPKDISESLGISTQKVKRRLNTYYALEIFRNDSDYGEYFVPNKLSAIFYEIMGKLEIREQWLQWNTELNTFTNKENMRRLFSWLVPYENESGEMLDPIITKRDEIRVLAKFIMDEEALDKLEDSRSIGVALEESQVYSKEGFKNSLKQITKILSKLNLGTLTELTDEDKKTINEILEKMESQKDLIKKLIQ
ncbi:hypothetical protein EBB54_23605 [Schaedlerella arabinosiphila]|uniref:Uncharacterized protein n=1 Tax=Schaedlerella arabinosiphila TaxID=2044587 RepID=A0A3R8JSG1_9FIRM|nr:ParB N-terminal domain-containing protein [Schaedlerella arabinosiphila]RRK34002.1 hypothetical protein EBB54_23605 [Schaedlerella arabinosiphila]